MEQKLRQTIKRSARHALRGNWCAAVALTLLVIACSVALSMLEEGVDSLLGLEPYFDYLGTPGFYLDDLAFLSARASLVTGAFALLTFLLVTPVRLARKRWYLLLVQGTPAPVSGVFHYFGSLRGYLRALHVSLAIFWRMALLAIPLYLPGVVVLTGGVLAAGLPVTFPMQRLYAFVWVLCGILLLLTATAGLLLFGARYFIATYAVGEGMRVSQALRFSVSCMKGRAGQWLEMQLFYLGWFALGIFIVPLLYVSPYYETAMAIYARYRMEAYRMQQEEATAEFDARRFGEEAASPDEPAGADGWSGEEPQEPSWNFKGQEPEYGGDPAAPKEQA